MKEMWVVWNHEGKTEGVMFDNENDALQTSTGEFEGMYSAIGESFFDAYEENAPLQIERIVV